MSSTTRRVAGSVGGKTLAVATAASLGTIGALLLAGPAQASSTVDAQLSLTGVVTSSSPTGGDTVGIHPGDAVSFTSSAAPTAGLSKLGLTDVLSSVTGLAATDFQVTANFSALPGGSSKTVLKKGVTKKFDFSKTGTYSFTWTAQQIKTDLLGNKSLVAINLDGNDLKKAGVALNAQNQYVGKVVVAKNPPKSGISIQVPKTSVQPQAGPVKAPKVSLPGVTTPTIPVSVPDVSGTVGKVKKAVQNATKNSGKSNAQPNNPSKSNADTSPKSVLPVPAMVVPQGSGQVIGSSSNYAYQNVSTYGGSGSNFSFGDTGFGTPAKSKTSTSPVSKTTDLGSQPASTDQQASSSRPAATSGMPVVLAIVALVALVLVAGTYARLFLLKGGAGSSETS